MALIYRPVFWVLVVLIALVLGWIAARRKLRWMPAWLLRLLMMGVVVFALLSPTQGQAPALAPPAREILVVDLSSSIAPLARDQALEQAQAWQSVRENRLVVLSGAAGSLSTWGSAQFQREDLPSALALADQLASGNDPDSKVILATDGWVESASDVQSAIQTLTKDAGSQAAPTLDVLPLPARDLSRDLVVLPPVVPTDWWAGADLQVLLPVNAPQAVTVEITYQVNDTVLAPVTHALSAGENLLEVTIPAQYVTGNMLTFSATVHDASDPVPENNTVYAATRLQSEPRLLLVTTNLGTAGPFGAMLETQGFRIDYNSPISMPVNLDTLGKYDVVILHNFSAGDLGQDQMITLQNYVAKFGRGLLFLGGQSSYTLGMYNNTPLESVLPILLESPPKEGPDPMLFMLLIDRSYSMEQDAFSSMPPIQLAKEAAMRAVEALSPQDRVGVMTYSTSPNWDVPITSLSDPTALRTVQDAIAKVIPFGGTMIYEALNLAVEEIISHSDPAATGETRHILLLSDGASGDGSPELFTAVAQKATAASITISTIALGQEADAELMRFIANAGHGRYYQVGDAADLPKVMVAESEAARKNNLQLGDIGLASNPALSDHPILNFPFANELPRIAGYNAVTVRDPLEGAEDILLAVDTEDPVLSTWQYGLGRTAAWMSDIGEAWAPGYNGTESGPATNLITPGFWAQVIRYVLPNPGFTSERVTFTPSAGKLLVQAEMQTPQGLPRNKLAPRFIYTTQEGTALGLDLRQTAPGIYEAVMDSLAPGAYRGLLQYTLEDEGQVELASPLVINPRLDYDPNGDAAENLDAWASLGGGQLASWEEVNPAGTSPETARALAAQAMETLLGYLLLGLVLSWPVEIALRRQWLPWQ